MLPERTNNFTWIQWFRGCETEADRERELVWRSLAISAEAIDQLSREVADLTEFRESDVRVSYIRSAAHTVDYCEADSVRLKATIMLALISQFFPKDLE